MSTTNQPTDICKNWAMKPRKHQHACNVLFNQHSCGNVL